MGKSKSLLILLVGGAAALLLLLTGGKAKAGQLKAGEPQPRMGTEPTKMKLSKNFNLSEFLVSSLLPIIKFFKPSKQQIANLKNLVFGILQPLRDKFGTVYVTSGGRVPALRNAKGQNIYDLLKAEGKKPAKDTDHNYFSAADIVLKDKKAYGKAFHFIKDLPDTRQVILYLNSKKNTAWIHVAAVSPGRPAFKGLRKAFFVIDGKQTAPTKSYELFA